MHSSGQDDTGLTPWSNPQTGEQAVSGSASRTPVAQPVQKTSGQSLQVQREKRQAEIEAEKEAARKAEAARKKAAAKKAEEEKRRKRQQSYQSQGESGEGRGMGEYGEGPSGSNSGSGGENSKVICTEMVAQGLMTARARQACLIYAHRRLSPSFMDGYHFWAVPYVRLMRRFDWAARLVAPFVHHRTQEVRYRLGLTRQGSWRGKLICALHDPLCSLWGRWIRPGDYRALYGGFDITES